MTKRQRTRKPAATVEPVQVLGYVRVSTLTQVREGEGLAMQRERIEAWARYQGLPVGMLEGDEGVSGASTAGRPAFRRVVRRALQIGPSAVLVVYKLDRLGRNALDVQEALAVLLAARVRVVAIADGVDSASGMGAALLKLLTSILATFAELERESIATRLQDGRRRASAHNRVYAVEPDFGRRVADPEAGTLEDDPGEQRALVLMRAWRAEGRTYRQIGADLEAAGHRPRRGSRWSTALLHRLVTGRRVRPEVVSSRVERARAELLAE